MKRIIPILLIIGILIIDQWTKIYIKTHWVLGQEYRIFDWFIIHFTENNGMAYGMELGGDLGKLALSVFRIIAISLICFYFYRILKQQKHKLGFLMSVGLILAGAIGNMIDSAFYGMWFNDSLYQIAEWFPESGGYSQFLYGKVVDMLYFPLINGYFPDWLPIWGGEHFIFFRPVFNIADASISVGIFIIILFYRSILLNESK